MKKLMFTLLMAIGFIGLSYGQGYYNSNSTNNYGSGYSTNQGYSSSKGYTSHEIKDSLSEGEFSIKVLTLSSNDTLDIYDMNDEFSKKYSSPIVLDQYLFFYHHNKLIKIITPPIPHLKKRTIHNDTLFALKTPLYEMCSVKATNGALFYYVSGADYCFGQCCLEFSGLYSSIGEVIFQGFSNEDRYESLSKIFGQNELSFGKWNKCINITK